VGQPGPQLRHLALCSAGIGILLAAIALLQG